MLNISSKLSRKADEEKPKGILDNKIAACIEYSRMQQNIVEYSRICSKGPNQWSKNVQTFIYNKDKQAKIYRDLTNKSFKKGPYQIKKKPTIYWSNS